MPETITSYYTFTANTRAKAAEVGGNFSNYRGTYLPIRTDTATAADDTYNLGNDSYRFDTAFVRTIDFRTSTATSTLELEGDTSNTTGAFKFKIEGVTKATIDTTGITHNSLVARSAVTTTAALGQLAMRDFNSGSISTTGASEVALTGSTCTVTTNGRPVLIGIMPSATSTSGILFQCTTNSTYAVSAAIKIHRDSTTITSSAVAFIMNHTTTALNAGGSSNFQIPASIFSIDPVVAGTYNYHARLEITGSGAGNGKFYTVNAKIFAVEI